MAQNESYQGLARKWRPQRFEDLIGQESLAQSFQSALRQGRLVHGHLLAGPRGVGKTTSARILAKALNCGLCPDFLCALINQFANDGHPTHRGRRSD